MGCIYFCCGGCIHSENLVIIIDFQSLGGASAPPRNTAASPLECAYFLGVSLAQRGVEAYKGTVIDHGMKWLKGYEIEIEYLVYIFVC